MHLEKNERQSNKFKASFISHICKVKDKKAEYPKRLKEFNTQKSVKVGLIAQKVSEKKIYESIHRRRTSRSIPRNVSSKIESVETSKPILSNEIISESALQQPSTSKIPSVQGDMSPISTAVNQKTIKQMDSLLIHVDQRMRSMLDQGNCKSILNAVQSENRVSPDRVLIVKNPKKDQ